MKTLVICVLAGLLLIAAVAIWALITVGRQYIEKLVVAEGDRDAAKAQVAALEQKLAQYNPAVKQPAGPQGLNFAELYQQACAQRDQNARAAMNYKNAYEALQRGQVVQPQVFSEDELRTLINLCHPDRHGGKESAQRITARLLELRA